MTESKEIRTMRLMAWERMKGEMEGVLYTFWEKEGSSSYDRLDDIFKRFIEAVQDEWLID